MKRVQQHTTLIALTALFTACSPSTSTISSGTSAASSTSSASTSTTPTTSSTSSTTSSTNQLPATTASFTVAGTRGSTNTSNAYYSITVNTDNLLQVTVNAGSAGSLTIPGYGFSANYNCVTYKVTVLGDTVETNPLSTGTSSSDCQGAATSQMIDFSSRLTTGHGPVTVQVESSKYDFDCVSCETYPWLYSYYCNNYCPMDLVYKNHNITGTLSIVTNGSS